MKITKNVLKEMIEAALTEQRKINEDIDVSSLVKTLGAKGQQALKDAAKAAGLPEDATATDVAKKVTDTAKGLGKDLKKALDAVIKEKPKTSDDVAKIIQGAPDTGLTPLKMGAMSKMPANKSMAKGTDAFVGMQTTGPNLPSRKKARKKARKRKCPKLPLRIGCQGSLVKEVQKLLMDLGYNLGRAGADGDFGGATKRAVMKYQRAEGIGVDGIVGDTTYGRLKSGPQAAAFRGPGKPEKAKRATAAKKDDRLDTPIVGGVPEMSRVEAIRATRDEMVPVSYTKRYRRPSNVRFLAIKALKYLIDEAGAEPGQAYSDLLQVFGLSGIRYFEPDLLKRTSLARTTKGKKLRASAKKFKTNLENVLGIEIDEL